MQINEYLFHIPHGGKTSKRLKEWIKLACIKKHISFHCARHTFGCLLIESGALILAVKKLMRHRVIRTTLQYVEKVDKIQDSAPLIRDVNREILKGIKVGEQASTQKLAAMKDQIAKPCGILRYLKIKDFILLSQILNP